MNRQAAVTGAATVSARPMSRPEATVEPGGNEMVRIPFPRFRTSPRNRGTVLLLMCTLAVVIGASMGWSQPAPDTILLPDLLGPLRPPYHLAFGGFHTNIYVASESSDIIVVDGNTFQRIKRINTGTPVGSALLVSQHNRLYCSYPMQGRIGVIDCATNNVVGSIPVGTRPTLLCYSSGSDKLYCGDTIDCTVSVIECATNAVLKVIPVGASPTVMACDPTTSKVYAGTRNALLAISSSGDSIVSTISSVKAARSLCVNKRRQKLYIVPPLCGGPDTVIAVSTPTDSVIARMPCWPELIPSLACNETTDRLYGAADEGWEICEFDCVGDTVIRYGHVRDNIDGVGLVCDSVRNRLCYLFQLDDCGYLDVLDCATLDIMSETYVGPYPAVPQADPPRYRILCACGRSEAAALTVLDYKGDSLYARGAVPLSGWTHYMYHNPASSKLYCWWGYGVGGVGVIDEQTNRLVAQAFLSRVALNQLAYSRTSNKLYFEAPQKGLAVMDGARDSITKAIGFPGWVELPCWCRDDNKVYCSAAAGPRRYIAVIDCNVDSVVRTIDVYDYVDGFEYLGEGRMLCVRCYGLTLIDTHADSVLVDTAIVPSNFHSVAHTEVGGKVYIARNGQLYVLSSGSLSLLTTIDWPYGGRPGGGGSLLCTDTTRKLYWFSDWGDSMLAIDTRSDTVVARIATAASRALSCFDQTGRYMFCFSNYVRVYDTQTDGLVAISPLSLPPECVTPNPEQGCIYVGCEDLILVYTDAPPGVEEAPSAEVRATKSGPTVAKGVLLMEDRGPKTGDRTELLDAAGRKVLDLHCGANDVRALAPGVYFVREARAQAQAQAIRKVVVTR